MKRFISLFVLLAASLGAAAQEILSQPEARFITEFPFRQFSGGVIMLKARFENIPDSLNFILDTGSGGISLDSATCAEFTIPITSTDSTVTGIGGVRRVPFAFDRKLHFPGLTVEHLNFHVNDYSVLTSVYGEKIDGIIGYSFLSRYIVKIDFDSNRIAVYSPGRIKYPEDGHILHPVFTSLPIQWLRIKDRQRMGFNFYFDTGAGLCFLMSEKYAADSSVLMSKRKPVITQAEGMGGKLQMRLTVVKELKIGPYRFKHVPTYLYKDDYNVTSYPYVGGLIGNDLLRRFNIILNYPVHEIHLHPNSHFYESFDYGYTGLGIYVIDGKIIVEDVIPGSPGDRAHFKSGDEILGVGNNISGNIQTYKNILQTPGQDLKVTIRRNGSLQQLYIYTESIR